MKKNLPSEALSVHALHLLGLSAQRGVEYNIIRYALHRIMLYMLPPTQNKNSGLYFTHNYTHQFTSYPSEKWTSWLTNKNPRDRGINRTLIVSADQNEIVSFHWTSAFTEHL